MVLRFMIAPFITNQSEPKDIHVEHVIDLQGRVKIMFSCTPYILLTADMRTRSKRMLLVTKKRVG